MVVRTRSHARLAALEEGSGKDLRFLHQNKHDSATSLACDPSTSSKVDVRDVESSRDGDTDSKESAPRGAREASPALRFSFRAPCLCQYHALPKHMQFNQFILSGYRVRYSTRECVRSLVQWHNETVNVYTHAAAMLVAVVAMSTGLCRVTSPDRLAAFVGVSMLPLFAAYVLSIAYHGFMAHSKFSGHDSESEVNYNRLLCADVAGVVAALALPWACTTYFAFAHDPKLLMLFGSLLAAAAMGGVAATQSTDQTKRIVPLGFLLLAHWATIVARMHGLGMQCSNSTHFYVTTEALIIVGGAINALFLPERFFPGKVDFILNSHQIMHICTLAATYTVYCGMREDYICFRGNTA